MVQVADGSVRVSADLAPFNKELKRGLGQAESQAQTFSQKINSALSPKNLAAGLGVAFGASQVVSFFGDAIQAAGEFEDSVSATGVIFGEEAIPALQEWADEAHSAFGASKQDALEAANQFAIFGSSAGLVGDDLTKFSTELVQLGGDLASFFGGTTEDAIAAVGSALRGEFEPIRRYGVLLDDATLRQQAFEMGIIDSIKNALTPQERVLAAQAAIFDQTSDAQGDFARTSDGLMNTQRDLAAELENVSIEVGQEMLPIMLGFVTFLKDEGIPIMREFIDLLKFEDVQSAEGIPILGELEDFLNVTQEAGLTFNDMITGREQDIRDAAEAIGIDYMTMRRRIHQVLDEVGGDHEEAIRRVTGTMEALPETTDLAVSAAVARWKEGDLSGAVAEEAAQIPADLQAAQDEAADIAFKTPGVLAGQLRAGIEDYDAALEELATEAENSVSDLNERQVIEGLLASQDLTDALNSDSTRTRLNALDLVEDLIADYELLAPGALGAGNLVNPALADGMDNNMGLVRDVAEDIVDAAGNPLIDLSGQSYNWGANLSANFLAGMSSYYGAIVQGSINLGAAAASGLRLRSPAEKGPLSEPASTWGEKLGLMFAAGMRKAIGPIEGASLALGGAAVLQGSFGTGSLPMNAAGMGNVGGGVTYVLNVNGVPKTFNSRDDFMDALDDLGAFGEGRLQ